MRPMQYTNSRPVPAETYECMAGSHQPHDSERLRHFLHLWLASAEMQTSISVSVFDSDTLGSSQE
jgi:hypothetical protein